MEQQRRKSESADGTKPGFLLLSCCILLFQLGCQEQAKVTRQGALQQGHRIETPSESVAQSTTSEATIGLEQAEATPEVPRIDRSQADTPAPEITFENVVHDFGEVALLAKKAGQFRFTNTGDGLLRITEIKRCCGVVIRLSKNEFAPGESGTLTAEYRAGSRAGVMRRQLIVHSNDKARPEVALTLRAKIVERVSYTPKRLKLLPRAENPNYPRITLTSLDRKTFSIVGFKSTADCVAVDFDSSVQATNFILQPKVNLEHVRKGLSGFINIDLSHPECDKVTIPFKVLAKFEINPQLIIIPRAKPHKPEVRKVWIRNNYGEDFEVESASSKNNFVRVLSQQKIHNGYQLEVEITPPAARGERKFFVDVFSVNTENGQKLSAICRGYYSDRKE